MSPASVPVNGSGPPPRPRSPPGRTGGTDPPGGPVVPTPVTGGVVVPTLTSVLETTTRRIVTVAGLHAPSRDVATKVCSPQNTAPGSQPPSPGPAERHALFGVSRNVIVVGVLPARAETFVHALGPLIWNDDERPSLVVSASENDALGGAFCVV